MTDMSRPADDIAALRAAVEALTARLDRIEAQAAQPSAVETAQTRLAAAGTSLRGSPPDAGAATGRGGLLWMILTICAGLLALILMVELAEETLDGLWHLGRWID